MKEQKDRVELGQNSYQWRQVTYRIQLATGQAPIKLLKLFKYPDQLDKSQEDSAISALVDTTDLKSDFKTMVVNKTIPMEDLIVICGHINLNHYHQKVSKVFSFLICEVVLGQIAILSQGFNYADSLLIEPQNASDPFHYNVLLKSQNQYQVKYQCSFVLADKSEVEITPLICSSCGIKEAQIYCKEEQKHFCSKCSSLHHPPPPTDPKRYKEVVPQHTLESLNRTNMLPLCETHMKRHEMYCLKCEKYLCPVCGQQPSHYQNSEHTVRPIEFLYTQKRQANAKLGIKHKDRCNKFRGMAESKQAQIQANYQEVKKAMIAEFEKAMEQLEQLYKERIIAVHNDLINAEMEIDRINWNLSFLKSQENVLKPIHYFRFQTRLEQEMSNHKLNSFHGCTEIESDIDHFTFIRVGDTKEINEIRKAGLGTDRTERQYRSIERPKEQTELINKVSEKLLIYNPESEAPRKGSLSLLLENSDVHFFKFKQGST